MSVLAVKPPMQKGGVTVLDNTSVLNKMPPYKKKYTVKLL